MADQHLADPIACWPNQCFTRRGECRVFMLRSIGGRNCLEHAIPSGSVTQQATCCEMLRVEHYGRGAPPHANPFLVSRPVPAVTGAFMCFDRKWFERIHGPAPQAFFSTPPHAQRSPGTKGAGT
jgi:hypothetical protein